MLFFSKEDQAFYFVFSLKKGIIPSPLKKILKKLK